MRGPEGPVGDTELRLPEPAALMARAAELVGIPSESRHEQVIAGRVEEVLAEAPWLEVVRVGDNVVARTDLGASQRLLLAGHLDTVPASGNQAPVMEDGRLMGLGAVDMKGGLAVLVELALGVARPALDVTFVFYACEEIDRRSNGLGQLAAARPELLEADAAILAEPTGARVEAGCQGSLRLAVTMVGRRAHTARAWMGTNAIHRLAPLLAAAAGYRGRRPVLDGCEYREALQAVAVEAGVAGNVVPDRARVTFNHRFAPDRDAAAALAHVRSVLAPGLDSPGDPGGDTVEVVDAAPSARPDLGHPLLTRLVEAAGAPPRAKLGWTDVAFFAERGMPAANFGPGDPLLAHTPGEWVSGQDLEAVHNALRQLLVGPAAAGSRPGPAPL